MRLIRRKSDRIYTIQGSRTLLGCEFQVEKFKADGRISYKGPRFKNTILDTGLDKLSDTSLSGCTSRCVVGTGTSEPATNQGGLDSALAQTNDTISSTYTYDTTAPASISKLTRFEFSIGSCTGNLTEVGLSNSDDIGDENKVYFNRQLFRDEYGDPVTISVDSDEGLRVLTEVFLYAPLQEGESVSGSFLLNDYDVIDYSSDIDMDVFMHYETFKYRDYSRIYTWLSDVYAGTSDFSDHMSVDGDPYTNGTFERTYTRSYSPGTFVGTLRKIATGFRYGTSGYRRIMYYRLDTPITIEDDEELTLVYKSSWGRVDYES